METVRITSTEFRAKQQRMFDLADAGNRVIIRRSHHKQVYVLIPISDDEYDSHKITKL